MSMNEKMRVGAARVALRALWTAAVQPPTAFGPTRIQFESDEGEVDEIQAAERLATAAGPVALRGEAAGSTRLRLLVTQLESRPHSVQRGGPAAPGGLEFLRPLNGLSSLVLAAGQAYKVSAPTAEHLVANFLFSPSVSGGGGPPEDPWTRQLNLPPHWLDGCGVVWMLGRQESSGISMPMRPGDAWDTRSLVVV